MKGKCQRMWRGVGAVAHYVRWSWRFGGFGFRSRLSSPALLTNTASVRIGKGVSIRKGSRIEVVRDGGTIEIGDGTSIQFNFHCGAANHVVIGKDVLIAGRVYITDHDHVFDHHDLPARLCRDLVSSPVIIEDGVWLGEGCVVLKGVRIGQRSVVGANAVVTKSVPEGSVVCGVPAKVVRRISIDD
ncbi:MAG: acyltransferase [Verrucomicrobia bacterium]|nr:acyltransferase [Verrucomicrobiota bacterium]